MVSSETKPLACAVVPAGGVGARMGEGNPKQLMEHQGKTLLEWTLSALCGNAAPISPIVIPLPPSILENPPSFFKTLKKDIHLIEGGATRQESVLLGLKALNAMGLDNPVCLVHDAARPMINDEDLRSITQKIEETKEGACLVSPVRDTLKRGKTKGTIENTVDRSNLWHALTPQGSHLNLLLEASEKAWSDAHPVTDDASILEYYGSPVHLVEGDPLNMKVTHPGDWKLFTRLMG